MKFILEDNNYDEPIELVDDDVYAIGTDEEFADAVYKYLDNADPWGGYYIICKVIYDENGNLLHDTFQFSDGVDCYADMEDDSLIMNRQEVFDMLTEYDFDGNSRDADVGYRLEVLLELRKIILEDY